MKNIVITKDFGTGKANAQAKAELTEIIINALAQVFGDENVLSVNTNFIPCPTFSILTASLLCQF